MRLPSEDDTLRYIVPLIIDLAPCLRTDRRPGDRLLQITKPHLTWSTQTAVHGKYLDLRFTFLLR